MNSGPSPKTSDLTCLPSKAAPAAPSFLTLVRCSRLQPVIQHLLLNEGPHIFRHRLVLERRLAVVVDCTK